MCNINPREVDVAFAAGDKIGIFACYRDTNNSPTIFSPNFMHNQPVAYDGNIWTYSPTKYWYHPMEA